VEHAQQSELREAIDEAVTRLPERQRMAVVLAYFEGRTHDEAAKLLGCPRGTIATLLARAREHLRRRLAQRGLAPAAGGLAWLTLEEIAPAAAPELLAASTVGAASAIRLGLTAGAAAPATTGLVEDVMRSMFLANLKVPAMALAVVLAAGAGIGVWLQPKAEGQAPATTGTVRTSEPRTTSTTELDQLKEQIRLAEAVLQNARKRLTDLETTPPGTRSAPVPTGPNTTPPANTGNRMDPAAVPPPMSGFGGGDAGGGFGGVGFGIGAPGGMSRGASVDRLRRIEQLAEELRKEVEALRRESRPPAMTAPRP
jgi:hypothetical protein